MWIYLKQYKKILFQEMSKNISIQPKLSGELFLNLSPQRCTREGGKRVELDKTTTLANDLK